MSYIKNGSRNKVDFNGITLKSIYGTRIDIGVILTEIFFIC